jgi:type IV secretory pathway TraG/TraD family ATPase VirD4
MERSAMVKNLISLLKSRKRRREVVVQSAVDRWALTQRVLCFGDKDFILLGQLYEGVGILGGTGAGKTSGSGQLFARAMISMGFGGLVLCAKKGERELWESYCRDAGRLDDLIVFGPDEPFRFNFLDYELSRSGDGAGLTENIVRLFLTVIKVSEKVSGGSGGEGGEQYWQRALTQLLRNLVDLLVAAMGRVTVPDLYRLAVSAPSSMEQMRSDEWRKTSFCFKCLTEADKKPMDEQQKDDFALVADYFLIEWPGLSDKTRSVILSTFTSMADVLNRGLLKRLFSGETNITPKAVEDGKIILIDCPVKEFGDVGLFANILWKNSFQRSIERRDRKRSPRGVFLWQDEAQLFVTDFDMQFQTTARASGVATFLLSQSISNFYAVSGDGQKGKAQVDSLWGNLNLKIFHANGDAATGAWIAEMVGKTRQRFMNASSSQQNHDAYSVLMGNGGHQSGGFSEQMDYEINPAFFASSQLRTGGPEHKFLVDAILFSPVVCFHATGKNYMHVTFDQRQS